VAFASSLLPTMSQSDKPLPDEPLPGEAAALAVSLSEQRFAFEARKLGLRGISFEVRDDANGVLGGSELRLRAGRERPTT
jgi:hypothetical protein